MAKIALVEDDRATSEKHREILATLPGVVVSPAFSYEEAVALISLGGFDLLVIDIDLGGKVSGELKGFDLLRDFGSQTTTIIVTGMPEENLHAIALKLKAYEFINKPIVAMDLINKARHALGFDHRGTERDAAWPKGLMPDGSRPPHVLWRSKPVRLTLTQLTIVHCLANQAGQTVELRKLATALKTGTERVLASHIVGVRKKFLAVDKDFDRIQSDPGLGYFWKADE